MSYGIQFGGLNNIDSASGSRRVNCQMFSRFSNQLDFFSPNLFEKISLALTESVIDVLNNPHFYLTLFVQSRISLTLVAGSGNYPSENVCDVIKFLILNT